MRRALKSPPALVAPATAEAFRTRIKAVDPQAERLQQEAMYELARPSLLGREVASSADAARTNVAAYEAMLAVAFARPAVETVLTSFVISTRRGTDGWTRIPTIADL